jgi:hypothetical protein
VLAVWKRVGRTSLRDLSAASPSPSSAAATTFRVFKYHNRDGRTTPSGCVLALIWSKILSKLYLTAESGPLWRRRQRFSANLAMSDHLSRALRAGIG